MFSKIVVDQVLEKKSCLLANWKPDVSMMAELEFDSLTHPTFL